MFGYIKINKMDLTFREFEHYKSMYCGICKYMKKNFGEVSRLSLNYDITFLQLILTSIYNPKADVFYESCIVNPLKKKKHTINMISQYCAAMTVVLTYYKLEDDIRDEKDLKSKLGKLAFKKAFDKAYLQYTNKVDIIGERLKVLEFLEKDSSSDMDKLSNAFASVMEEIFAYNDIDLRGQSKEMNKLLDIKREDIEFNLRKLGFNIGKYIYILDAFEDLEGDLEKGRFNPFKKSLNINTIEEYEEFKQSEAWKVFLAKMDRRLSLALAMAAEQIDKLKIVYNRGIIDNIIYSGVYYRYKGILYNNFEDEDRGGIIDGI